MSVVFVCVRVREINTCVFRVKLEISCEKQKEKRLTHWHTARTLTFSGVKQIVSLKRHDGAVSSRKPFYDIVNVHCDVSVSPH